MRARVIVSLLLLTACGGKAETEMSPFSAYEVPEKLSNCPTGGKRPADLPTIRLPEALEENRQALITYSNSKDQANRVCKSRLLELGDLYRQTVADLLRQIKGK